ncbi:MAG: hypothetical protein NVS1B14_04550 [Vulcanimicrobiaceae bacterium]
MLHQIENLRFAIEANPIAPHAEDGAVINELGMKQPRRRRHARHFSASEGTPACGRKTRSMQPRHPSSIRTELGFLLLFMTLFSGVLVLLNHLLLPHQYPKPVVLALASIIVAIVTIAARYAILAKGRR